MRLTANNCWGTNFKNIWAINLEILNTNIFIYIYNFKPGFQLASKQLYGDHMKTVLERLCQSVNTRWFAGTTFGEGSYNMSSFTRVHWLLPPREQAFTMRMLL
jgi:hypothetical protein